jgi:hypothetical protein
MQVLESGNMQFIQKLSVATADICDSIRELGMEFFEPIPPKGR